MKRNARRPYKPRMARLFIIGGDGRARFFDMTTERNAEPLAQRLANVRRRKVVIEFSGRWQSKTVHPQRS